MLIAYLPQCPSVSKVLVCPIKCPKYPFAPVTSCPYNCAHFFWCPFFSSAHLPQIAKCPFAPVPRFFAFPTQAKTVMVSAARGCKNYSACAPMHSHTPDEIIKPIRIHQHLHVFYSSPKTIIYLATRGCYISFCISHSHTPKIIGRLF